MEKKLEELEIVLDIVQIEMITENQFKTLVEKSIGDKYLEYLVKEKNKKQKVKHIQFEKIEIQNYHPSKTNLYAKMQDA